MSNSTLPCYARPELNFGIPGTVLAHFPAIIAAAIVVYLDAALEQFSAIEEDLKK